MAMSVFYSNETKKVWYACYLRCDVCFDTHDVKYDYQLELLDGNIFYSLPRQLLPIN